MKKLLAFIIACIFTITTMQAQLAISFYSVTNVTCFGGSNGSAAVSATNGTGPYTYTWMPSGSNSSFITNVPAGTYTVMVTDGLGATGTGTVNIIQPTQLVASATSTNITCFNLCSGRASVVASGGSGAYTYSWNPIAGNSPTVNQICAAGNYTYYVTDANACNFIGVVSISNSPPLVANITTTNSNCGNCSGSMIATVTSGMAPFVYNWIPSAVTTPSVHSVCAGSHTLQVIDANGCIYTNTAVVTSAGSSIPNTTITSTAVNESCNGSHDGSISLSIAGSNPGPFTYQWDNGATTQSIYNLTTGSYVVTVSDGTNCATYSQTVGVTGGANCGSISGNVFLDANNNCTLNGGEVGFQGALITAHPSSGGYYYGYSDALGNYTIPNLNASTFYTVTLSSMNLNAAAPCGTVAAAVLSPTNANSIINFPVILNTTQPDVQVSVWSSGIVPGFNSCVNYYISNLNGVPATGIVKATLPTAMLANFTSASPNYTISADTIMWNFNLPANYYSQASFNVCFTTPVNTPLGSTFTTCVVAQTTVADINPANNTFCYQRMVTGSFDPNDKTVSPVGTGTNGGIVASETDLTYLIRFQNTGNGPAVNITVMDTLSANVDVTTFKMLQASHNYHLDILAGNLLRWKFNNIMLADSNSNEPASHGYIQYKIKRTNNNVIGTQIKNKAEIYFDFNAPVVTNTALNTIVDVSSVQSINNETAFIQIYPNPTKGILMLDISTSLNVTTLLNDNTVEVLNVLGEVVFQTVLNNRQSSINLQQLNDGVYFIKVTANKQSIVKRVVLSK